MSILRNQSLIVGCVLVAICLVPPISQAADGQFERFEERLKRDVPSLERVPTTEMLEDDPEQRVDGKTRAEAQEHCDAYASSAGLHTCEARKTTVPMARGRVEEWHCVCR